MSNKADKVILGIIFILAIGIYSNMLKANFVHLDDYPLIIENDTIRSISAAVASSNIDTIINSIIYKLFGLSPTAFHAGNIILHLINIVLVYYLTKTLFDKGIARISTGIFAVHPVNTEAIAWISGKGHLINTLACLLVIHMYIKEAKDKPEKPPIKTIILYTFFVLIRRSVWILVIPLVLITLRIFLLREEKQRLKNSVFFVIPIIIFLALSWGTIKPQNRRPDTYNIEKSAIGTYRNQENFKPIIEGGPYTISTMIKLYLFPKTLSVYYDGTPITPDIKISMGVTTLIFFLVLGFAYYKKEYKILGLMILLMVPLAPTFSPIKITWYMAERYLYLGSVFFSILLAVIIVKLYKNSRTKLLAVTITSLLIFTYCARTWQRNKDWQTTKSLAAATLRDTPNSIRATNDMGNGYMLEDEYSEALDWYNKSLEIDKYSNTAIKNIGLAILKGGPDYMQLQQNKQTVGYSTDEVLETAKILYNDEQDLKATFYITQLLKYNPNDVNGLEALGDIYLRAQQPEYAKIPYLKVIEYRKDNEKVLLNLGYISYVEKEYETALQYLEKAQQINPDNQNTKEYVELVKEAQESDIKEN